MPRRAASDLDETALAVLIRRQAGVVARRQVLALGGTRNDVRRRVARREWSAVLPGVYVAHTGTPTRAQREWAAVLHHWPAALHRESALAAHGMTRDRAPASTLVHVMVDASRRVDPAPGVRVERVTDMLAWTMSNRRPPRARLEFALLKTAADLGEAGAVALLSDAVFQGLTTPERLIEVLEELVRLPGRSGLLEVLRDVAAGTRSVLERRYLEHVELAHGLPRGERQVRHDTRSGVKVRDVAYPRQRTLVELDGAFGHRDALDRWGDLQRDLEAALADQLTLRPGWAQVLQPCRLATVVAAVLRTRGWEGSGWACGPDCGFERPSPGPPDLGGSSHTYRPDPPTSLADSA